MEQNPLLQTKLYIPPIRPGLVSRPRLLERLNAGLPTRGELMGTVGASDSVTTTLLNILGGLDRPSAGANNKTWRASD